MAELFIVRYGHSDKEHVEDKAKFLEDLIKVVNFTAPVIISPSMSGSFALPYLLSDPKTADKKSHGFIPVAPVDINKYTDKYKDLQVNHITHVLADTNDNKKFRITNITYNKKFRITNITYNKKVQNHKHNVQ
jgi:hypothetical protein